MKSLILEFILRGIAVVAILGIAIGLTVVCNCSKVDVEYKWTYKGSATISHIEYKFFITNPKRNTRELYTIYYTQDGGVYPIKGVNSEFETGTLVHIYRKWTIDGYKYKVLKDPIH